MFALRRQAYAGIGIAIAAVGSTVWGASPALAASSGMAQAAQVEDGWSVEFQAASGQANKLVVSASGRTITLDDVVAIKAGKGCAAVQGDRTKVTCTTPVLANNLDIRLGDKNDTFINRSASFASVFGGSGNDVLTAGKDGDALEGEGGNDKLHGRAGWDLLYGGSGNDIIDGGGGEDDIYGEAGNDKLHGGAGVDLLHGGSGNDIIDGGGGEDNIYGEAGNDKLYGGAGNDRLAGGAGNDLLNGGAGRDRLDGGPGTDKTVN